MSVPSTREILGAALCDATNWPKVWEKLPYEAKVRWLHRADDVMRQLAARGYMVENIDNVPLT